jgi:hypothetical protein
MTPSNGHGGIASGGWSHGGGGELTVSTVDAESRIRWERGWEEAAEGISCFYPCIISHFR